MRPTAPELLVFLAVAAAMVAIGAALLRMERVRGLAPLLGWLALGAGLAAVAALALAEFTARLGPENLWFRAPTFYGAMVILLGAGVWWLRRPAPRALRFGLPAILGHPRPRAVAHSRHMPSDGSDAGISAAPDALDDVVAEAGPGVAHPMRRIARNREHHSFLE